MNEMEIYIEIYRLKARLEALATYEYTGSGEARVAAGAIAHVEAWQLAAEIEALKKLVRVRAGHGACGQGRGVTRLQRDQRKHN